MNMLRWNKLTRTLALGAIFLGGSTREVAADLYVTLVGDGASSLSSASYAVSVKKFADAGGSELSSINLPTAANGAHQPLTLSGSATSEGFLSLSTNGQYLTLGGYGVGTGTASVPQSTAARVIGRIEVATGTVDTTTALVDAYIGSSGNNGNFRSVTSTDGTKFWTTGTAFPSDSAGFRFATFGATTSTALTITPQPTNVRVANIIDGQLYGSSGSGAFRGVNQVGAGLPETAIISPDAVTLLPGFDPSTSSPESAYDFWFKDANTLYVADDRAAASGGGIQKWELSGGTWGLTYTLATGSGARGLAGKIDGGNAVLYATTTQNSANNLVSITDTGSGAAFSILATAATNTVFRGVEFVSGAVTPVDDADFDNNGVVDGADFLIWQRGFAVGNSNATGDADGNGVVNGADLTIWKNTFGGAPAVSAIGAVPEPASLTLAGLAAIFATSAVARRRG